jgi:hypothetical protein
MCFKGINYDTGFISAGTTSREPFDPQVVKREMEIIHDDLHCTAVRITGGYPERLEIAARYAAEVGLEVWFCPFTNNLISEELLELLADRAERLRKRGGEIVFLTGSELRADATLTDISESESDHYEMLLRSPSAILYCLQPL